MMWSRRRRTTDGDGDFLLYLSWLMLMLTTYTWMSLTVKGCSGRNQVKREEREFFDRRAEDRQRQVRRFSLSLSSFSSISDRWINCSLIDWLVNRSREMNQSQEKPPGMINWWFFSFSLSVSVSRRCCWCSMRFLLTFLEAILSWCTHTHPIIC